MDAESATIALDTSVVINFIHVQRLSLLAALPFTFVVADQVVEEISRPGQASALANALERKDSEYRIRNSRGRGALPGTLRFGRP